MLHILFFSVLSVLSIIVEYMIVLVRLPNFLRYLDAFPAYAHIISNINNPPACEVFSEVDNGTSLTVDKTLLLLAATLQDKLAHLTQTEVSTMLTELQFLKNTVGSHVPLFENEEQDSIAPAHTFAHDAWHGDACLIKVMQWLLKRRSPEPSSANLPTTTPVHSAEQVIWHVSYSLDSKLRDQPISEIDDLMAKLKVQRKKTAHKRDKAILSDLRNSAVYPDVPFAEKGAS
ncbi:hypothetical protein D6D01_08843 [Aureobasidium pullulans]|uniref:Uncharacterized protein n=1 Tax=Aureobasidium pullulans TaxID=5580 RepID=A0A4V4JRX7_AURPU|nr:hypothetical protein D6D01_08843 [Aureobasidium pullulans]